MKIKNVVIINDFDYVQGGASQIALDTAEMLAKYGINVYFFSAVSNYELKNNNIINISCNQKECLKDRNRIRGLINGIYNFSAKKKLENLLKKLNNKETIVHIHGWTKALSSSVFDIVHRLNFKIVLTMHDYFLFCPNGGMFNYKKNECCSLKAGSFKCFCSNCDSRNYLFKIYRNIRLFVQNKIIRVPQIVKYVIYVSNFSKKILQSYLKKEIVGKIINNPVKTIDVFEKNVEITGDYFLYVGRICKEKGVEIFCEAIMQANKKGIIIGDGPEFKKLKNKYKDYKKIEFLGWKNKEDIFNYMYFSLALVFPSKWYETAGLTVVEAHSTGTSVIMSNDIAANEYFEEGDIIFEKGNVNELANIFAHYDAKKKVRKSKQFSIEEYGNRIINLYEEILKGNI